MPSGPTHGVGLFIYEPRMRTHRSPTWTAACRTCVALLALLTIVGCARKTAQDETSTFLAHHWPDPIPAQGTPPPQFSALEASLAPEACGQCHTQQYDDWRTALHSKTMGPGIEWQFEKLGPDQANRCLRCHAPLAEQKALLAAEMGWPNAPQSPPPDYVPGTLAHDGLACAACHVRGHVRFGPPAPATTESPHGGFAPSSAFQDSRFCATCHQFPDDGPRLAGKLREDTYRQWSASAYAPGTPCQSCHMPDGRHLWRGIHDPDMLRKALEVELHLTPERDGRYVADVIARNKGAGHDLPTYMVPKIYLVLLLERPGRPDMELARDVIGWQSDVNFEREAFDTRIPAGKSRRYRHTIAPPQGRWQLKLRVDVAPGEHYERMFRFSLANVSLSPRSRATLIRALADTEAKRYTAIEINAAP